MIAIARLARDERGVSMIEYCFLSAFVAISLLFAVNLLGVALTSSFIEVGEALGGGSDSDDDDDDDDDDGGDGEED